MTKVIAIVGMGEGIALAVARRFAREGFAIAMVARNEAKLQGFKDRLKAEGYDAYSFIADGGDDASLTAAITAIQDQLGTVEVLVYNIAIPTMKNVLDETVEGLMSDFKANVVGGLVAAQAVLPAMKAQGNGTILFTGGGFSMYPSADFASLSIGKAGIRSLTKMLAEALQPQGIRVGTVTVCGTVNPDDPKYNPTSIAENYWAFYANPSSDVEIVY
ncbi:SDR family NAD(P)-dependent oxidoreductase [Oscillatoria sp. FACHB-1407]|uniref:SDR family NAD(P)-dependent oxidoreductase n=1 Tax=Oscillatoria sp. FACHB-1407 TaxID=2692847 RepID=UPI001682BA48|nr:SDR family NAD(P)-dependent oxidoreductase [Oscillatoria sp. FACHB-1407]MBD2461906.1 SDR family NAD(P)-dependent oxidoreductase [Oscillatoria sp. FACHB-1407]